MSRLLVLPNQLFDIKYFTKDIKNVVLYEHPQYFTKYNFNKKKLVLHRASMKKYQDYLEKKGYHVDYLDYSQKLPSNFDIIFEYTDKLKIPKKEIIPTPNFLLSMELLEKYRKKTDKFFFNAFYMWSKKELNILPGVKSQDKSNRKRMPKNLNVPSVPKIKNNAFVKEAIEYVEKHFSKNYGNCDNFNYPIDHDTAHKWLSEFINKKFNNFGDYQDFIKNGEGFMFHSLLSSSINIGLINPKDIIDIITPIKSKIPLNSYEGYVRQLFWREYQRLCYLYFKFDGLNYFGNSKKLNKKWYTGELGIPPVDDAIKFGFETGYLHHIQRLMVMGNFMNISGISPKEGLKWFMEFSCDSYEWVMYQNVYDMVFFVSDGKTMRRPYASTSNYIMNMSDYKRGEWNKEWDDKYREWVEKNKDKLYKYRYYFPTLRKK